RSRQALARHRRRLQAEVAGEPIELLVAVAEAVAVPAQVVPDLRGLEPFAVELVQALRVAGEDRRIAGELPVVAPLARLLQRPALASQQRYRLVVAPVADFARHGEQSLLRLQDQERALDRRIRMPQRQVAIVDVPDRDILPRLV